MQFFAFKARKGFTLIELLLVVGIIGLLTAVVMVAINPAKQLGEARNAQRRANVNTILNAIYQYTFDNGGNFPGNLSGTALGNTGQVYKICKYNLGSPSLCGATATYNNIALFAAQLTGSYIVKMPQDPKINTATGYTGYSITKLGTSRVTISVDNPENGATISVTR